MYEWTHTSKSTHIVTGTPPNLHNSKLRVISTPNDVFNSFNESSASILKQIGDTGDVNFIINRLKIAKSKFHKCQMDASSLDVIAEVFNDLEMICSELFAVRNKLLSRKDLMNETDLLNETNSLYVSCVNETVSDLKDINATNEENNSTVETIENLDNDSTEDFKQNICDKIETCKYCGGKTSTTIEMDVARDVDNREDKETQTSYSLINEDEKKVETNSTTNATVSSSEKNSTPNSCQNVQNIPIPPPMPVSNSILPTTTSSIPPPPPPPPPMQSFSLNSTVTMASASVSNTPQSMPPPPPPIPPPLPGNNNLINTTITPISSIPPPPPPPGSREW